MDFTNTPQDVTSNRPRPSMPSRRVFSDIAPRPLANPSTAPSVRPAQPTASALTPPTPVPSPTPIPTAFSPAPVPNPVPSPTPTLLQPAPAPTAIPSPTPTTAATPAAPSATVEPTVPIEAPESSQATLAKTPKPRNQTGHAGLIGFVLFVVLTGLLASPFLPGKVFDSFPGSSQSFSSGDQSLACLNTPTQTSSSTAYDSKSGFPITYTFSTTTTQKATCDGKQQTAVSGHNSQFNPLGLLIDVVTGLVVAIVFAKIWRKIFGTEA